ncbi:MAG: hypothetical protein EXS39_03680 [Opitutaceae bacterium]|nr:hypothetical protein [Opitutaceae bacterium]
MNPPIIISGGTILDGRGGEPFVGDVLVRDGRIAEIGAVTGPEDAAIVDARGLYVAPGFIDIHSHSDYTLYVDPRAISSLAQGVTLEVVGNCGHGCAPFVNTEAGRANLYGYQPGHNIPWQGIGEYLEALAARQPAVNVAVLVPNGCLRLAAVGALDRPATPDELERMKRALARGIEEGAYGYSTGLESEIERECTEAEIIELCKVTAKAGGFYATHTRNRYGEARETIAEAIRTCEATGGALQISHLSCVARLTESSRWAVEQAIEQVDAARARGLEVTFDLHTRSFGMTTLATALPLWALEGSAVEIGRRLADVDLRQKMKSHPSIVTALARGGWSRMVVHNCRHQPELSGQSIADLARVRGCEPFDVIYDILLEEGGDLHSVLILGFVYRQEDTHFAFEHPQCMIGSDATTVSPDRPLESCLVHGTYTWAAWFWRHFVRETKKLAPQEAVRRLTSLPAQRIGLPDRGVLQRGAWADIAVFDPQQYAERGTIDQPQQTATGMKFVLVNGALVVSHGQPTGTRSGQVLRYRG